MAIKTSLQHEFDMKDLGPLHYFLGLEIKYLSHGLFVSQHKYATDLIHKAGLDTCHSHITPCQSGLKLLRDSGTSLSPSDAAQFRSLVGCLQYLTFTRPDIAYSVNSVCQFLHCPTDHHFQAALRILKYVKGTSDYGITFRRGSSLTNLSLHVFSDHNFSLQAYSDADWAGDPNDRKSTTGFVILLNGSPVS
ncbi:uncharacterized mitochondrial protein AtMg00810-like [Rosa chinensis]|uniref:uncharacterized mitochondrial protein AtMg00810-like n=1 Tax=Rosa chinensis TaxID=74649 RepID=UPI000D091870|nr:uncharacterized mitochondrial protein AtMg00810-like [Rosa chinensis]